jgi:hypothetical protein
MSKLYKHNATNMYGGVVAQVYAFLLPRKINVSGPPTEGKFPTYIYLKGGWMSLRGCLETVEWS